MIFSSLTRIAASCLLHYHSSIFDCRPNIIALYLFPSLAIFSRLVEAILTIAWYLYCFEELTFISTGDCLTLNSTSVMSGITKMGTLGGPLLIFFLDQTVSIRYVSQCYNLMSWRPQSLQFILMNQRRLNWYPGAQPSIYFLVNQRHRNLLRLALSMFRAKAFFVHITTRTLRASANCHLTAIIIRDFVLVPADDTFASTRILLCVSFRSVAF